MLVFAKEGLILYSMPKTGTTSVDEALANRSTIKFSGTRNGGLKHMSPTGFRKWERSLKKQFPDNKFESCCVMREPIEWLGSWYRYRKRDSLKNNPRYLGDITFNNFLEDLCDKKRDDSSSSNLLDYQSRFLIRKNKFIIDRIFPYGKFQLFISYLNNKFNTKISLPQTNVSPTPQKNELEIDPHIAEKIKEFISIDCQIYEKIMALDSYDSSNKEHFDALNEIINKDSKS